MDIERIRELQKMLMEDPWRFCSNLWNNGKVGSLMACGLISGDELVDWDHDVDLTEEQTKELFTVDLWGDLFKAKFDKCKSYEDEGRVAISYLDHFIEKYGEKQ